MTGSGRSIVLFASTSGSCRSVADIMVAHLGPQASAFDLKELNTDSSEPPTGRFDRVIAGTPTYGQGDWHYAWERHFNRLAPLFKSAGSVMLFALGDARGHGKTFAGGLRVLADRVAGLHVTPVGAVPTSGYTFVASPAASNGWFPGLVLEYRRHRHAVPAKVAAWLAKGTNPASQLHTTDFELAVCENPHGGRR